MKWHYPIVVFDLETRDSEPRDIIEIGSAIIAPDFSILPYVFKRRVWTANNLSERVVNLTGITYEDISLAKPFSAVGAEFVSWAEKATQRRANQLRLAAWGNYFDVPILRNHYEDNSVNFPFSGTAIDVKTAAIMWCSLAGYRTDSLSVSKCAQYMGFEPIGDYHRADVDAEMTARILRRVMTDLSGGVWVGNTYVEVKGDEERSRKKS